MPEITNFTTILMTSGIILVSLLAIGLILKLYKRSSKELSYVHWLRAE